MIQDPTNLNPDPINNDTDSPSTSAVTNLWLDVDIHKTSSRLLNPSNHKTGIPLCMKNLKIVHNRKVWHFVNPPENKPIMGNSWIYTIKKGRQR